MNGRTASLLGENSPTQKANPAVPADGLLVAAARRGDVRAFESLYRLHCEKVMGLCLRMTRKHDVAEDCVQQTFIKAWSSLPTFEGRSSFRTWLHSIAVNVVMSHLRSNKPWLTETNAFENDTDVDALDSRREQTHHDTDAAVIIDVERALMTLPEGARCVVVLQTLYGYSHEEVAGMLNIAVGTCKAQLHRARHLLRARLDVGTIT